MGSKSQAARIHQGKVAMLGCAICRLCGQGPTPATVHHIREGQGGGQRAHDFLVIPLCPEHHQGATGIHGLGTREFKRRYKVTELDLLGETLELLA